MLPGSQHEEDEGTVCSTEGRVIKINAAVDPPGDARQDWKILQDVAAALGRPRGFKFASPREIFEEMRRATAGGVADYSGITYEKIESRLGVFWPCPAVDPNGAASEQGFQTGDVILEVGGKKVAKPADVHGVLDEAQKDGKRTVLLRVKSGDATKFVALRLGKA